MPQNIVITVLVVLFAALQVQLHTRSSNLPDVASLRSRLQAQTAANAQKQAHIDQLFSEVADLQEGLNIVEEKARHDLGMVKPNEILVLYEKN